MCFCLFTILCIYSFSYLLIYFIVYFFDLIIDFFILLFIHLFVCLFINLIQSVINLFIYLLIYFHEFIYLFIRLFIHLLTYLQIFALIKIFIYSIFCFTNFNIHSNIYFWLSFVFNILTSVYLRTYHCRNIWWDVSGELLGTICNRGSWPEDTENSMFLTCKYVCDVCMHTCMCECICVRVY